MSALGTPKKDMKIIPVSAEDAKQKLGKALRRHNEALVGGSYAAHHRAFCAYALEDQFLGGLYGWLSWGWLSIDLLWVEQTARHQGVGQRLLAAAEAWADGAGINRARLDTASFQGALPFYLQHGYQVCSTRPLTAPDGSSHEEYGLQKGWSQATVSVHGIPATP